MDLQALARAHRMGQTRDVRVIRLVSCGPPVYRGSGLTEAVSKSLAPAVSGGIASAAAAEAATPSLRRLRSAALLQSPAATAAASPSLDPKSLLRTRTPRSMPEPLSPPLAQPLSGGPPPRWSYSLSVEELLQLRAHGKLRTEEAVIQRGQFHHGLGRREGGGADTSSPRAVSSPVARTSEPQGSASPSPSPRASPPPEPPAADMRLLLESVAAGPVAAAPPGPANTPVTLGDPFDPLSDTQLFEACARSPADLDALLTWARYARGRLGALTLPPLAPLTASPNVAASGNTSRAAEPDDDEAEEHAYQLDEEDYINAALALTAPCAAAPPVLLQTPPPVVSVTSTRTSSGGQQKKEAKDTPSLVDAASASAGGESVGKRSATSKSGSLTCLAGASVSGPGGPTVSAQAPSGAARPRSLRPPLTGLAELDAELRRFVETR